MYCHYFPLKICKLIQSKNLVEAKSSKLTNPKKQGAFLQI